MERQSVVVHHRGANKQTSSTRDDGSLIAASMYGQTLCGHFYGRFERAYMVPCSWKRVRSSSSVVLNDRFPTKTCR